MARRSSSSEQCDIDMTPMIDVVFQLIIFFVVTLKLSSDVNPDIILEDGKHGVTLTQDNMPPSTLEIEVDRRGRISIHNATLTPSMLRTIINNRIGRHGYEFPVLIRADRRARHEEVRRVMDICTGAGIWKLSFLAVQEHKAKE
ncbi:MAG: biopolymer transporter ExbD [Kiritimatiellae bacterium]|jgi:biopolymer transport protein ExbD|nr:biopolymer transporter ExbD [Kiritimatiellia bacterium]HON46705.1 biopolymer transporter ExbD [Kiritimatiellia bacterium]